MPEQQPEVTLENLEKMTNEAEGYSPESEPQSADSAQEPTPAAESQASTTQPAPASQVQDEATKLLADTPYKSWEELVKGYKNATGELTKRIQKIKPYEPFLNQADTDPQYAEYLQKAHQQYLAYKANPQLFQQPQQPQQAYDLYTPEGQAQFQQTMAQQMQQQVEMVRMQYQQELAKVQQQAQFDNMKAQFKAKFPDADPDEIYTAWQDMVSQLNPFEIAYRVKNWDKAQSEATSKARQEVNKQLETAQKTKTPAAATPAPAAKIGDIIDHIGRYGPEAAYKRFGKIETIKALMDAERET